MGIVNYSNDNFNGNSKFNVNVNNETQKYRNGYYSQSSTFRRSD